MTGKDPHRPEGKAGVDAYHRRLSDSLHSAKQVHDVPALHAPDGAPSRFPAEEQFAGSRPGVPSLVKRAVARREGWDEDEE